MTEQANISKTSCSPCPEEVIIAVVSETVPEYEDIHPGSAQALGNMAVYRQCLQRVREKYDCTGATENANGQIVCPLAEMAKTAKALATMPYTPANFQLQLDKVGSDEKTADTSEAPAGAPPSARNHSGYL